MRAVGARDGDGGEAVAFHHRKVGRTESENAGIVVGLKDGHGGRHLRAQRHAERNHLAAETEGAGGIGQLQVGVQIAGKLAVIEDVQQDVRGRRWDIDRRHGVIIRSIDALTIHPSI